MWKTPKDSGARSPNISFGARNGARTGQLSDIVLKDAELRIGLFLIRISRYIFNLIGRLTTKTVALLLKL